MGRIPCLSLLDRHSRLKQFSPKPREKKSRIWEGISVILTDAPQKNELQELHLTRKISPELDLDKEKKRNEKKANTSSSSDEDGVVCV